MDNYTDNLRCAYALAQAAHDDAVLAGVGMILGEVSYFEAEEAFRAAEAALTAYREALALAGYAVRPERFAVPVYVAPEA